MPMNYGQLRSSLIVVIEAYLQHGTLSRSDLAALTGISRSAITEITQNLLAEMLGVQRPTITNAFRELERAGLIAWGRRQVTILDRQGLTKASCECYQLVRTRLAFHLPKTYT